MLPRDPRSEYEPSALGPIQRLLVERRDVGIEQLDDLLAGAAHLGLRRSRLLGTKAGAEELQFALSIFTLWPFKPQPSDDVEARLVTLREHLFVGLAETLDFSGLEAVVPDETLKLTPDELFRRQQESVGSFLVIGRTRGLGASES